MKRVEEIIAPVIFGCLIAGGMTFAASAAAGEAKGAPPQTPSSKGAHQKSATTSSDRGEQVFHQNCHRCHQEPQGFSPSVSGTIARHMRVRANLSDDDYKALLKFLNP